MSCGAAAGGLAAAGAAGFATAGTAGFAAAGAAGGAGGLATGVGAADTPAPGESVRETSPLSGSPGTSLAGLSAAACGGVGSFGSSVIVESWHERQARPPACQTCRLRPVER